MCWNATISLQTYLFALSAFSIAYSLGYPLKYLLFPLFFSQIQLTEYLMWSDQKCTGLNQFASLMAFFIILLEPVTTIFRLYPSEEFYSLIKQYAVVFFLILYFYFPNKESLCTKPSTEGHLVWNWLNLPLLVWLFYFLYPLWINNKLVGLAGFLTFLYSFYNYYTSGAAGSMWCWIANIYWVFILIFAIGNYTVI